MRWSYNFLDWIVAWEVDEYVDLTRPQKKQLNKDIRRFHVWHRQTQLPLYEKFLQQLEQKILNENTTHEALKISFNQATVLWQNSLEKFTTFAPPLFRDLSSKQLTELIKNTTKETDKSYDKYMGRNEETARLKQNKHMQKQLVKWLGPLTKKQKSLIIEWSLKVSTNHKLMALARADWQKTFDKTLLSDRNQNNFDREIQTLLVYPERLWSDAYQQSVITNQNITIDLFVDISHSLNQKQKYTLRKKLRGYISDFQYLAKN